jgi:hypothetical protein
MTIAYCPDFPNVYRKQHFVAYLLSQVENSHEMLGYLLFGVLYIMGGLIFFSGSGLTLLYVFGSAPQELAIVTG